MAAELDPVLGQFLDELSQVKEPPLCEMPLPQARELNKYLFAVDEGLLEPVAQVLDRQIDGLGGKIPVRIFVPHGSVTPYPVVVYFHGGGWVLGSIEESQALCHKITRRTPAVVISVDYRLAPENKFPVAAEECYAVTKWACEHAADFSGDPDRIAVCGESAGGNLAAAVALMARDKGGPHLRFQALFYPALESYLDRMVFAQCKDQVFLTYDTMDWFWNQYLRSSQDRHDPYASPLAAQDLSRLPPALVVVAEHDPLTSQGELYADRLRKAGSRVTLRHYFGMIHSFLSFPLPLPMADQACNDIVSDLRMALAKG